MLSAFKNFFVTFLIAALVFGSVAYFATRFLTDTITGIFDAEENELDQILNPTTDSGAVTSAPVTEPPVKPDTPNPEDVIQGESFKMLFIVTDYQPDIFNDYLPSDDQLAAMQNDPSVTTGVLGTAYRRPRACAVLLLRADKERSEFTFTAFPSAMRVSTSSGEQSMADLYNLYGRDFIVSEVASLTGLEIDYDLLLNITELSDIVTELGGIPMYFSKELYYNGRISTTVKPSDEDKDFLPLLYGIGKNNVDGPGAVALLMNEDYSTGVAERCVTLVTFFTELLNKLTAMSEADLTAFYDNLCEDALIDTTFTVKELVSHADLIYAYTREDFKKTTLSYPGRFVAATETSEAYFEPNTKEGLALFKKYRPLPSSQAETTAPQ